MNQYYSIITLKDIQTGDECHFRYDIPDIWMGDGIELAQSILDYYWTEGNGSCDCERAEYFDIEEDFPCGDTRFKLISIGKIE